MVSPACASLRRDRRRTLAVALWSAAVLVAGATGGCGGQAPRADAADASFVLRMLPHHLRAIEVGRLAEQRGADPRVVAFGRRIVAEQAPEAARLRGWVATLGLHPSTGDAGMADGYITDGDLARLRSEPVAAFDRDVLLRSATSEEGAAMMADAELAGGRYGPARALARSIAGAPGGEIPQLRALAAMLPS